MDDSSGILNITREGNLVVKDAIDDNLENVCKTQNVGVWKDLYRNPQEIGAWPIGQVGAFGERHWNVIMEMDF
ncbi:hypothetical protein F0562_010218 [Nyssa sinensis]|uniref:Uncharacterized protein n=1 Tax=Nyssa sinensis TaxID=561372 RepID=A0A5J4ZY87_9ASTE|nr:hypothetical protein F0562_010218 [Nyssa sinensis]